MFGTQSAFVRQQLKLDPKPGDDNEPDETAGPL